MTKATLIRIIFNWGWLRGSEVQLVHYHHGGKLGSIQAGLALEKELRVLHLIPKTNKRLTSRKLGRRL